MITVYFVHFNGTVSESSENKLALAVALGLIGVFC